MSQGDPLSSMTERDRGDMYRRDNEETVGTRKIAIQTSTEEQREHDEGGAARQGVRNR